MRLGPRHSPLKAWLAVAGDRGPGPRPLAVVSADWPGSGLAPTCRNTDTHNLTMRASQTPSRCSSSRLLLCSLQWCTSYRERQCLGSMVFPQSFFFGGAERAEALIGAPVSAPSSASSRWTAGDMTSSVGRGPDRSMGQPGDLSVDRPDRAQKLADRARSSSAPDPGRPFGPAKARGSREGQEAESIQGGRRLGS